MLRGSTVSELLSESVTLLKEAGVETPRLDAEVLLAKVLSEERTRLIVYPDRNIDETVRHRFNEYMEKRRRRVPVAYITGEKEFYSLTFEVTPDVLIPRPETELLVDMVLYHAGPGSRVLDVGTGSGAIAITAAHELSMVTVDAVDFSAAALDVARRNASRLVPDNEPEFYEGDLFAPVAGTTYDVIVSNPPYVNEEIKDELAPELEYEPRQALFAEDKGRDVVRRLIEEAPDFMNEGAVLLIEIGFDMKEYVEEASRAAGFSCTVMDDYAGLPRIARVTKE